MDWWQYPQLILPQQIPAPEPTTVLSFGLPVAILRLTSIPSFREPYSFLEPPTSRNRRSYVRRCIQASSSVVPPFISIGVISFPGVCRLLSRSRSRCYFENRVPADYRAVKFGPIAVSSRNSPNSPKPPV